MLQLLHLNVSKLERVLHLPPRLSVVSSWYQVWEGGGGPHVLADGRSRRDMGGQVRDAGRGMGAAARGSGRRG
jgi:hypothetical protein